MAGGSERIISFISQNIDKEKFNPTLIIVGFKKDNVYDINDIEVIYLNKSRILTALPFIYNNINIHQPHIVVSSISHLNTAMAMLSPFFRKTKFIGRESTVLSKRSNEKKIRKWSPFRLLPNQFKNLDALICQSQDMAEDIINNFNIPKTQIHVINNPISSLPKIKPAKPFTEIKKFITVGRLTEVKGHFRILEILSKLNQQFNYTIIGDGSLKDEVFAKAKSLGIYDCIIHVPFTNKVNDYIAEHDMFLQGSYVEGFPNALLESCVVGTPVIAFNVPGGTKEIIIEGVNGFLVENEDDFLEKLKETREWNPEKIRNSVYEKFNKETIIRQYEKLFINIMKN